MLLNRHFGFIVTGQQPDDELVAEAYLTRVEEMFERYDELAKYLVYQLDLHLWGQLLV